MLLLGLDSVPLDDVVVIVGALELRLHFGKLMLNSVELHTSVFSRLLDLPDFLFLLAKLQVDSLVLVCQLLRQGILEPCHQGLYRKLVNGFLLT